MSDVTLVLDEHDYKVIVHTLSKVADRAADDEARAEEALDQNGSLRGSLGPVVQELDRKTLDNVSEIARYWDDLVLRVLSAKVV